MAHMRLPDFIESYYPNLTVQVETDSNKLTLKIINRFY